MGTVGPFLGALGVPQPGAQERHRGSRQTAPRHNGLELGDCGRPYGTPCIHEHACVRCPMLRVDPRQRTRLEQIIRNLGERIEEAKANGWQGEVEGLKTSLEAAQRKLAGLERAARNTSKPAPLGMPPIPPKISRSKSG